MTTILNRNARVSADLVTLGAGVCTGRALARPRVHPSTQRSLSTSTSRGMGGTPMMDRKAGAPRVRGTRTPCLAAALSAYLMTAPRKGRGVLLSGFASEVLAPCSITSRPDKRLFLGARALFFIARNEGSSMVSDNYSCIHRIYTIQADITISL